MKYIIRILVAVIAAAVAFAAPAAASEDEFVRTLQTRYVFLSEQQLRSEGAKICSVLRSGVPSTNAVIMVRNDLGTSFSTAGEIVSAAALQLGC